MEKEDQRAKKDAKPGNEDGGGSTFYLTLDDVEEDDMPVTVLDRTPEPSELVKLPARAENEGNSVTRDTTFPEEDSFQSYCQSSLPAKSTVAVCLILRVQKVS